MVIFDSLLSDEPDSPFHETESRALLARYANAKTFLQRDATLTAFRREAQHAGILHIAAHGGADLAFPAHSALLLTPNDRDDGLLRADEIYGLHFAHAPFNAASSCADVGSPTHTFI